MRVGAKLRKCILLSKATLAEAATTWPMRMNDSDDVLSVQAKPVCVV